MVFKMICKVVCGLKDMNSIVIVKVGVSGIKVFEFDVVFVKVMSYDDYFDEKYV